MKDFALQLEGCSKEDRKKVIKATKDAGYQWIDNDRFKTHDFAWLAMNDNKNMFYTIKAQISRGRTIYRMPQDWSKIQEALGVSVEPMIIQDFEDGKMYHYFVDAYSNKVMLRSSGGDRYYSINGSTKEFGMLINGSIGFKNSQLSDIRELTDEEKDYHIADEHANGYHWDGKELVKIPEYVEIIDRGLNYCGFKGVQFDNGHYGGKNGVIIKVIEFYNNPIIGHVYHGIVGKEYVCFHIDGVKSSIKEAYEAQEAKKKSPILWRAAFDAIIGNCKAYNDFQKQMASVKSISDHQKQMPTYKLKEIEEAARILGAPSRLTGKDAERVVRIMRIDNITPLHDHIKKLEISNNELNVEIETKDKRISELEKNLIIMCELGNKVLS